MAERGDGENFPRELEHRRSRRDPGASTLVVAEWLLWCRWAQSTCSLKEGVLLQTFGFRRAGAICSHGQRFWLPPLIAAVPCKAVFGV